MRLPASLARKGLFSVGGARLALLALASASSSLVSAAPHRKAAPCPANVMAVIGAAKQNGYDEGWLAGRESVKPIPPMVLESLYGSDRKSRAYERCLGDLRFAVARDEYTLRATASRCVSLLPFGK